MFSTTDEDDFFNPTFSSNLASIFGTSTNANQSDDSSLIYTKPKQPKEPSKTVQKPTTSQSSVIHSQFVAVYKITKETHLNQGKCGFALIGDKNLKTYELLLYKSKQDLIMRTKLNSFVFTTQHSNFAYFCDEQKQEWSVYFEDEKDRDEFAKQIEIYGGKIIHFDKVAASDEEQSRAETVSQLKTPNDAEKVLESNSHSASSTNQTKAHILSRMAKMGQPILPVNVSKHSPEHSDSESDKSEVNRKPPITKRQKDHFSSLTAAAPSAPTLPEYVIINGQVVPVQQNRSSILPTNQPQVIQNYPLSPQPQIMQSYPGSMMVSQTLSDPFNIFLAENRTHNCEMRMNVTQLSSKLDTILTKLSENQAVSGEASESPKRPNKLQRELSEKIAQFEESQRIIIDLSERQEKTSKIIVELEEKAQQQAALILEQTQALEEAKKSLKEQTFNVGSLEKDSKEQKLQIEILNKTIEDQKAEMQRIKTENVSQQKLTESIKSLQEKLSDINTKSDLFAKKLKQSMNNFYQEIMEHFSDGDVSFSSEDIKRIFSQKLKNSTFTIIQEFNSDFKTEDSSNFHHELTALTMDALGEGWSKNESLKTWLSNVICQLD